MGYLDVPEGYVRATEATEMLGCVYATLTRYVQLGYVKRFRPEGSKQGFYLRADIEKMRRARKRRNPAAAYDRLLVSTMDIMNREANHLYRLGMTCFSCLEGSISDSGGEWDEESRDMVMQQAIKVLAVVCCKPTEGFKTWDEWVDEGESDCH